MAKVLPKISPESKTIFKNILIAVVTSVLGATAIYFLGFNTRKQPLSAEEKAEVNGEAWNTYVTVENIYVQSTVSLIKDGLYIRQFSEVSNETERESEKFRNSLSDLISTDGVDKEFLRFLENRMEADKLQLNESIKFYKGIDTTVDGPDKPIREALKERFNRFMQETKTRFTQASSDLETLTKTLLEEYGQPFNHQELLVFQSSRLRKKIFDLGIGETKDDNLPPDQSASGGKDAGNNGNAVNARGSMSPTRQWLTGEWVLGNGSSVVYNADGRFRWTVSPGGKEARGRWRITDNQLNMDIEKHPNTGKPAKWVFAFSNLSNNSCTLLLQGDTPRTYQLERK